MKQRIFCKCYLLAKLKICWKYSQIMLLQKEINLDLIVENLQKIWYLLTDTLLHCYCQQPYHDFSLLSTMQLVGHYQRCILFYFCHFLLPSLLIILIIYMLQLFNWQITKGSLWWPRFATQICYSHVPTPWLSPTI